MTNLLVVLTFLCSINSAFTQNQAKNIEYCQYILKSKSKITNLKTTFLIPLSKIENKIEIANYLYLNCYSIYEVSFKSNQIMIKHTSEKEFEFFKQLLIEKEAYKEYLKSEIINNKFLTTK